LEANHYLAYWPDLVEHVADRVEGRAWRIRGTIAIDQEDNMKMQGLIAGLGGLLAAGLTAVALAQAYPVKPIRWIVPYPAGGGSDVIARTISAPLGASLGQPIVVDNRPGAATIIGADVTARSPADGYTIATADSATLLFNPHLYAKLPYDPFKDFAYIAMIGRFPLLLVAHASVSARTTGELIAYAKANPDELNYASPGNGSPHHMAMVMFEDVTGASFTHVPYKGAAPAVQDLLAGTVHVMFLDLASGSQHVKGGKLKVFGAGWPKRLEALPDVPTLSETGVKGFEAYAVQGVVAPASTPREVVARLNDEINEVVRSPAVAKRFAEMGMVPSLETPEEFMRAARRENEVWGRLIKAKGIKIE
jgi:tripartite-type tricarboxylate transporter receptor subunit TctC